MGPSGAGDIQDLTDQGTRGPGGPDAPEVAPIILLSQQVELAEVLEGEAGVEPL